MRNTTPTVDTALNQISFMFLFRGTIEPSYIHFDSVDDSDTVSEIIGVDFNNPVPEDLSYSPTSGSCVTWYNLGGTLKYCRQGNATPVTTSYSLSGKPGVYGNYLYLAEAGGSVKRKTIDWAAVANGNANPFSASADLGTTIGTPVVTHGVSSTKCVVIYDDNGGLRTKIFDDTTGYVQPGRFMYPTAVDYTMYSSGSPRTSLSLGTSSAAVQLGENVYVYMSNPLDGSVDVISLNTTTHVWADSAVAVPTNLQSSLCEFRVVNAYSAGGKAYLVGQFNRTEVTGTKSVYTMILSSADGVTFSMDNFTYVSSLGHRFLACVANGMLHVGSANRIGSAALTYVFAGTSGSGLMMNIPMEDFISFKETSSTQAQLILRSGEDYYSYHPYFRDGSRVKLELGCQTTSGSEFVQYGTYIINSISVDTANGARQLDISLVNYSEWLLSGLNSPYYTEFFAKSSVYDGLGTDSGNLYPAVDMYEMRNSLSIDFWSSEGWDYPDWEVVGYNIIWKGGVVHPTITPYHKYGIKCRDLSTALNLQESPEITGAVTFEVSGWSHPNNGGANDAISVVVFTEQTTSGSEIPYLSSAKHFPITYGGSSAGDGDPFTVVMSNLPVGDKIIGLGLIWEGTDTDFCPARIDIISGIKVKYAYADANADWEDVAEGRRMPGVRRPYIQFSQKPYDAWNFIQVAEFHDDLDMDAMLSDYPCGMGLVGLAKDGSSYILARYNRSANLWEIVKVRECIEILLVSGSPSETIGNTFTMGFTHRDGRFAILLEKTGVLVEELFYEWTDTDGWMYESETISKKCGIWGGKLVPWFACCGLDAGGEEDEENADGIPMMPGYSLSGWPDSGEAQVGDCVFSYTSKVSSSPIIGPYQFRNQGQYPPPFGIDKIGTTDIYGLEFTYLNWTRDDSADNGKLVACDNGGVYIIYQSEYQVWITTGGEVQELHNRCRQYSANAMIAKNSKWCSNREYITGGLVFGAEGGLIDGKYKRQGFGAMCTYHIKGDIYCHWYRASSGKAELNVKDLIDQISKYAGASATFPGDLTQPDYTPGAGTIWKIGELVDTQGMDIRFEINDLGVGSSAEVISDAIIDYETSGSSAQSSMRVTKTAADTYRADYIGKNGSDVVLDSVTFALPSVGQLQMRVIYHDNFTTLDIGGRWIYTFSMGYITYASPCNIYVRSSGVLEFRDVLITELCDWREAIYIDLETDGRSAIGSVIQERPIEQCHKADGSIAYWYEMTRDRVVIFTPRRHTHQTQYPRNGASDAIIQGMYTTAIQIPDFASRYGFATKVMRMPNLTIGAVRATRLLIRRMLEQASMHTVYMRPDIRVEVGDVIEIDFYATGTNKHIDADVIVENTNLSFSANDNNPTFQITGREEI